MIHHAVTPQLDGLSLDRSRPLLAVDVDEVIVGLAGHLAEFAETCDFSLKLSGYQLDGALFRRDGSAASREDFTALFRDFFETQTLHQRMYPGAAEALKALSEQVQVVILTNVPFHARDARVENLRGHGIDYPLVANDGPKGGPLRWLSEQVDGPVAFIDDSPTQLASAAKTAPDVVRIHYVGDTMLRGFLADVEAAQHRAEDWPELQRIVESVLLQ